MSKRIVPVFVLAGLLAACGGNPFLQPAPGGGNEAPENPTPPLDGTPDPTPSGAISRYEPRDEDTGSGYAENITYDPATDTFSVDNLGFDGANLYRRGAPLADLGPYQVYEADQVVNDPVSGDPIPQFDHRMIAGVSTSGRTQFAIVRTGAYVGYGFGGFVMMRDSTGVVLPTTGQAVYTGEYAGIQDFDGRGGLRYVRGDAFIAIDFEDFNDGDAVRGEISNRRIYDLNGVDITAQVLSSLNLRYDPDLEAPDVTELPTMRFRVGPGSIDVNGEIRGTLGSVIVDYEGDGPPQVVTYEEGNYYAIVSGANADEIVGIIVVTSEDPAFGNVTVRETGGFILYR